MSLAPRFDVVDDAQQPPLVVAVPVDRPHEERLARPATRTRVPGHRLVAGEVELQEADRRGATLDDGVRIHRGAPTRRTRPRCGVRPVLLDRVAVSERRSLEQRVHTRILHVPVVDLRPARRDRRSPASVRALRGCRRSTSVRPLAGPTTDAAGSYGRPASSAS